MFLVFILEEDGIRMLVIFFIYIYISLYIYISHMCMLGERESESEREREKYFHLTVDTRIPGRENTTVRCWETGESMRKSPAACKAVADGNSPGCGS